jgi:hypothetical protein
MPLDNDSGVSAISYPVGGKQYIYAFLNGSDHLYANYFDGNNWHWSDHGGVPGGFQGTLKQLNTPSAITFQEQGKQHICAFVVGNDGVGGNVHLHLNYVDGGVWPWADRGAPSKATLKQIPSAISYPEGGHEHIYVFAGGSNHDLQVNYGDSNTGFWADQGHPPQAINPSIDLGGKGTVSYSLSGKEQIYSFVPIGNHLYLNYSNGTKWYWLDQGNPFPNASNTSFTGLDSAITYLAGGVRFIHEFIIGTDQKLYRNHWDGSIWDWYPHGTPPQTKVDRMIGAVSYWDSAIQQQHINTFVTGYQQITDRHLYMNYWNGKGWLWEDHGKPANLGSDILTGSGSVITFNQNGKQIIYAFVNATNGHLYVNYWDGSKWHWADQGKP